MSVPGLRGLRFHIHARDLLTIILEPDVLVLIVLAFLLKDDD